MLGLGNNGKLRKHTTGKSAWWRIGYEGYSGMRFRVNTGRCTQKKKTECTEG